MWNKLVQFPDPELFVTSPAFQQVLGPVQSDETYF